MRESCGGVKATRRAGAGASRPFSRHERFGTSGEDPRGQLGGATKALNQAPGDVEVDSQVTSHRRCVPRRVAGRDELVEAPAAHARALGRLGLVGVEIRSHFSLRRPKRDILTGMQDLLRGEDGITRCGWAGTDALYLPYHDEEWGRPLRGDDALFEMLTLEGFQAGLSWLTILRKREAFRSAFAGFAVEKVAAFGPRDVERLMGDAGIVRNRAKIEAAIGNARAALEVGPGGLTELLWSYAPPARDRRLESFAEMPAETAESKALSKELKRRGFRFVGPTIVYAFMQAVGMVDDHLAGCEISVG